MAATTIPVDSEFPRELPLVGRKHDLERLYRIFGHEEQVEPTILITGDAGVGKTRLADTVVAAAERREWTAVSGRAYPIETGMPYSLLSDAFLPLLQGFEDATLTVLTRGTTGDLRQLFPALGGEETQLEHWDPGESRTRLFWSFTEFLKRLAERGPMLILAEDLHWADASSLSLLHFLARQLQGEPIRILGTYSRDYGRDMDRLVQFERSLTSLGLLASHRLEPLSLEATRELLHAVFQIGGSPLHEFAAHLYDWTHGNPYFLEETLKTLVHTGRLYYRDGVWLGWDVRHIDLPGSVRDALLTRLAGLSEPARTMADLVAVGGGRASVRLVGRVGEFDVEALGLSVDELTEHGVVNEREEQREIILELRHPMLRETLYRDLGPTRRRLLHRRLAEALEELHRGDAAPVDQLAYHFTRGGPEGEDPRTVRYLGEAGRAALRRHADREAVAYLVGALERYPDGDAVMTELPTRSGLQADLARGLARLGRYSEAGALWSELRDRAAAEEEDRAVAQALRHLGLLAFWGGKTREALRNYDQALEAVAGVDDTALEARIHLAAGVAHQEFGRADEARVRIERALELARALEDPTLLARAHRALSLLFTWVGRADDARRHGWQAVELGDRSGDDQVRFWGRWALASLEGLAGNTEEMHRLTAQAGQIADELRSPVLRLWTAELEVEYGYAVGDWDQAVAQGERAIQLATSLSQKTLLPRLLVWTATIYIGRGDLERARDLVDRAWRLAGLEDDPDREGDVHVVVPAHIGLSACLLAEERLEEAIEVGEAGIEIADRAGYVLWSIHLLLPIVAEAYLRLRDMEGAAEVGRRLRREGERIGHRLALGWADACDAIVLWLSGDLERGVELLEASAKTLDAIPLVYDAARIRRQMAGPLRHLGRRDEALAVLKDVHGIFGELGAQPELHLCREEFRKLDSRPPSRAEAEGTAELTPREVDVAKHVAGRLSNKAVARKLDISPRTVTTHLSNIYRKLGIGSRGELVDLVREGRIPLA